MIAGPGSISAITRWYTLDDPVTTTRLAERPRAMCWVASVPDLDEATRVCGCGQIIEVTGLSGD